MRIGKGKTGKEDNSSVLVMAMAQETRLGGEHHAGFVL